MLESIFQSLIVYGVNGVYALVAVMVMILPALIDRARISFRKRGGHNGCALFSARRAAMTVAMALSMAPYVSSPSVGGLGWEMLLLLRDGVAAAFLLTLAMQVTEHILVPKIDNDDALIQGNVSVAVVEVAALLATGIVASGAVSGEAGGMLAALLYFLGGQVVLVAVTLVHEYLTPDDVNAGICKDDRESAVAVAGLLISYALILRGVLVGGHSGIYSVVDTGVAAVFGFAFLSLCVVIAKALARVKGIKNMAFRIWAAGFQIGAAAVVAAAL